MTYNRISDRDRAFQIWRGSCSCDGSDGFSHRNLRHIFWNETKCVLAFFDCRTKMSSLRYKNRIASEPAHEFGSLFEMHIFQMWLHGVWRVKLLVAVLALTQVGLVKQRSTWIEELYGSNLQIYSLEVQCQMLIQKKNLYQINCTGSVGFHVQT